MRPSRGSLTQGKGDAWIYTYYLAGVRQPKLTVYAARKRDAWPLAEAERDKRLAAAQDALRPKKQVWTVASLSDAWLRDHLPGVKSPYSRYRYRYLVSHYILPALGTVPLEELSTADVRQFKEDLLEKLSPATASAALGRLTQMLKWAEEQIPPLVAWNVASRVKKPAVSKSNNGYFTPAELTRLLEVSVPPKKCAIALGMLGLRRGEVIGLKREADIDLPGRVIHVVRQAIRVAEAPGKPGKWGEKEPKYGGARDVPIPEMLVPIIKEQLEWSVGRRNQTDLLFVSPFGEGEWPMSLMSPAEFVAEACKAAGIERQGRHFHSLRHSFVEMMRTLGIPDRDIAHTGGWSNDVQIKTRYGNHPHQRRMSEVGGAFDEALAQQDAKEREA